MAKLVLSRAMGERVVLELPSGGLVTITPLRLHRDRKKVQFGIEADATVRIYREEVYPGELPPKEA